MAGVTLPFSGRQIVVDSFRGGGHEQAPWLRPLSQTSIGTDVTRRSASSHQARGTPSRSMISISASGSPSRRSCSDGNAAVPGCEWATASGCRPLQRAQRCAASCSRGSMAKQLVRFSAGCQTLQQGQTVFTSQRDCVGMGPSNRAHASSGDPARKLQSRTVRH